MSRKFWLAIHRWTGISFAAILLPVALTGSALAFQFEIQQWLDPGRMIVQPPVPTSVPDFERMAEAVLSVDSDARLRTIFRKTEDPTYPFAVTYVGGNGEFRSLYIDPYTGRLIEPGPVEPLMAFLRDLHVHLAGPTGLAWLVAASGVVLVAGSIVGVVLWWPKLRNPRAAFGVRFGQRVPTQATMLDLHNILGLYLLVPMIILGVTGAAIIVQKLAFSSDRTPVLAPAGEDSFLPLRESFTKALAIAAAQSGGQPVYVGFPSARSPVFSIVSTLPGTNSGYALHQTFVSAHAPHALIGVVDEREDSVWHKLSGTFGVGLHEGHVAGPIGRWAVLVCGLTLSFGVISGVWLWVKRLSRERAGRRKRRAQPETAAGASA